MLRTRNLSALAAVAAACAIGASSAQAAWTVVSGTPPTTAAQYAGVACTSSTNCLVVGPQTGTAFAQKWGGSSFTTLTGATTSAEFDGVGCASSTVCFAAGTASNAAHMELYNGTSFANSTTANPSGSTFASLQNVSCPSTTNCFAVGEYTSSGVSQPVIEHWTGTSWSIMTLTLPSGTTSGQLSDVSCTATTACTATGYYTTSSIPHAALILRYNGTSWTSQTAATVSGASQTELDGVSCTTATACNAVGYYLDASSNQFELAETWNGTTWTQKTVTTPTGGTDGALSDVSCYTTTSSGCIADGGYTDASGNVQPEAVGYNGTTWTQQTITKPSATTDTALAAVSCTSSTFCMLVGTGTYSTGIGPVAYKGP